MFHTMKITQLFFINFMNPKYLKKIKFSVVKNISSNYECLSCIKAILKVKNIQVVILIISSILKAL